MKPANYVAGAAREWIRMTAGGRISRSYRNLPNAWNPRFLAIDALAAKVSIPSGANVGMGTKGRIRTTSRCRPRPVAPGRGAPPGGGAFFDVEAERQLTVAGCETLHHARCFERASPDSSAERRNPGRAIDSGRGTRLRPHPPRAEQAGQSAGQYSSASMIVRTRCVAVGSAGSGDR